MTRTRFAPSPTGYLHIGGLRTALYAYLLAKKNDGDFILRIEDTDQERLVSGATDDFINTLHWAGIDFDEGPGIGGDKGPYTQSERLPLYKKYAQQLLDEGHAYRCFCSKETLDEMREEQMAAKKAPMYDRRCRYLSEEEVQKKLDEGQSYVIRQAIELNKIVKLEDLVRGTTKFDTNTLDDHVLLKSDGFPTYHLAVVVDDKLMEITHVFRGEEWLPSAPKHILLYEAFGWEPPKFAHLSLILNKDRTKLSKRQNDVSTQSYIEKGYSKEALVNFIALLGWNNSDNQEIYSLEELVQEFDVSGLQKAGAIFDLDKLNWFEWQWKRRNYLNTITEKAKELDETVEITEKKKGHLEFKFSSVLKESEFTRFRGQELKKICQDHITPAIAENESKDEEFFAKALVAIQEKILKEPENTTQNISFFFNENLDFSADMFTHEKMGVTLEMATEVIKIIHNELEEKDFESESILKDKYIAIINTMGLKTGQVMWPARVALTAEEFSPGAYEVAFVLGLEKTQQRLEAALQWLQTNA